MAAKFEKYKNDLAKLKDEGELLEQVFQFMSYPDRVRDHWRTLIDESDPNLNSNSIESILKGLAEKSLSFANLYHSWYSEALALVSAVLPDRLDDFVSQYKKAKNRKSVDFENYSIEDALVGLRTTFAGQTKADASDALPRIRQQVAIVKAAERRFESALFDIEALVQADILDSEIDVSRVLLKQKFLRPAGAICGVVIEKHLTTIMDNRKIKLSKKNPTIADLNDALKNGGAIDTPVWRFIQHLGDLRNLCVHSKEREPKAEEVNDLVDGTAKIVKTVF